jgi:nucleotidyltransferase/DNA polymerase involved in DNA repair
MGDLAALPLGAVQAEFGAAGGRAWRLARGEDDAPVIARSVQPTVHASLRFDQPLGSVDAVLVSVRHLLMRAFVQPVLRSRAVRQARLRALLSDHTSWERLITFKEALASRETTYAALKAKLELPKGLPTAPIEELALELLGLSGEAARQPSLFLDRTRQLAPIVEAGRQLRARYGQIPLYHALEVEPWSRIPERRWALVPFEP